MVVALAVGPQWWIDVQQLHSVASYPTAHSVIVRRRVHAHDAAHLARTIHALVCNGPYHRHRIDKYLDTLLANQPISDGEATDRCKSLRRKMADCPS